jgi:hypothetical protein
MNELKEAALHYAEKLGLPVFPVHGVVDCQCTCGDPDCKRPGKHPITSTGFKAATTISKIISGWWDAHPHANIGILSGAIGMVVDVDPRNGGEQSLTRFHEDYRPGHTVVVATGGGGTHYWYKTEEPFKTYHDSRYPGIDFQGVGSYIIAPPSNHIDGGQYRFIEWTDIGYCNFEFFDHVKTIRQLADVPKPNDGLMVEADLGELAEIREALRHIPPDIQYHDWIKVGQALRSTGWIEAQHLWHEYSSGELYGEDYTDYNARDCASKWRTFTASGGVTLGTLMHMSSKHETEKYRQRNLANGLTDEMIQTQYERFIENLEKKRNRPSNPVFNTPLNIVRPSEYRTRKPPAWRTKGVYPQRGVCMQYGASGIGKTFGVLDHAVCTFAGKPFLGHDTIEPCGSVYLCLEGEIGTRLMAAAKSHGVRLEDMDGHVTVVEGALHITEPESFDQFYDALAQLREAGYEFGTVYVDTLAQAMGGANENDGSDMGKAISHVQALAREFNCLIVLVHHTGKNADLGARGHSSLYAACDTVIKMGMKEGVGTMRVTKQKNGPTKSIGRFKLDEYSLELSDFAADVREFLTHESLDTCVMTKAEDNRLNGKGAGGMAQKRERAQAAAGWIAASEGKRMPMDALKQRMLELVKVQSPELKNPYKARDDVMMLGEKAQLWVVVPDSNGEAFAELT